MNKIMGVGAGLLALAGGGVALLALRYERNRQRADAAWQASTPGPVDIEAVEHLRRSLRSSPWARRSRSVRSTGALVVPAPAG
jgi:hypothetical protein